MASNFFIRCDGKYFRIDTGHILYVESVGNYVMIVTTAKRYLSLISLTQLEKELPSKIFCRVHRSYIVSVNHISSFDSETVYIEEKAIPINPFYKHVLPSKVKLLVSARSKGALS